MPKILIISGVHGNESSAVVSSMNLLQQIIQKNLLLPMYSEIAFLIGANEYGLINNVRDYSPNPTTSDLNRAFTPPVNPIVDSIKQLILNYDIIVDIHNSHHCQNSILISLDDLSQSYINFANCNNLPYIFWNQNNPTIKNFANSCDKIGFTIELNGMDSTSNIINNNNFLSSIIPTLANYKKILEPKHPLPLLAKNISSNYDGIVSSNVKVGDSVNLNFIIANIVNYDNSIIEQIYSPVNGIIVEAFTSFFTKKNEPIFMIQPKEPT